MNSTLITKPLRQRETIGWIDALRVLAIVLVVVSHCCDHFTALYGHDEGGYRLGAVIGSLVRPCVPLFAMMTGVLLFPVKRDTTLAGFYGKRIGRLLWPLIFWSLVLPVANFLAYNYIWTTPANLSLVGPFTVDNLVNHLYTWVFNFNFDTIPLWYLYMLIGIYLALPIVSRWLETASQRDILTVLYLWGVSLILPYIQHFAPDMGFKGNYGSMGIWGVCSWNTFGSLYYISGFMGYMVLAYYLARYPVKCGNARLLAITVPMFIVGFAITLVGYMSMMATENWALIELFWSFCSINVLMMTLPVYVWVERSQVKVSPLVTRLAIMSFGVYLCHFSIVQWGYEVFYSTGLPAGIRLLLNVICSTAISYVIVALMFKSRLLRRFVA